MPAYLVTYVQEDTERLVTFGPWGDIRGAAAFAWGARHALVRHWNTLNDGFHYEAKTDGIEEIASSRIAAMTCNGVELYETYFRIGSPIDPELFDATKLEEM